MVSSTYVLGACILLAVVAFARWQSAQRPQPIPRYGAIPSSYVPILRFNPPPHFGSTHRCRICNQPTEKRCSNCKLVFYCTSKHAKQDRTAHKEKCTPGRVVRGILLLEDQDSPREIDIVCTRDPPRDGYQGTESAQIKEFLGDNMTRSILVDRHGINGPPLAGYILQIYHRDEFLTDGSALNQCIQRITGGRPGHCWRGPIVVMRLKGTFWNASLYEDLKMENFMGPGLTYLKEYGSVRPM